MTTGLDILLVTGEYPPAIGGVGDYTSQLARALIARGHGVSVLSGTTPTDAPPADEPMLLFTGEGWGWCSLGRVARTVGELAPRVVHIQYQTGAYRMHPAIHLLPSLLRRLPQRPAIVVTAHDLRLPYLFPKADYLRTWLTRRLFEAADAVIVTNAADERRVRAQARADRTLFSPRRPLHTPIYQIPIGSNIAAVPALEYSRASYRVQIGAGPNDVVVAYFGLLSRTKGVRELVQALALLPPHFRLVVIGGAAPLPDDARYAEDVQAEIAAHGLAERVLATGPCDPSAVSAYLLSADLAVLPFTDGASYRRGSLLAALTHGLPVVTTSPTDPLEPPLVDGIHALLIPACDPAALAPAIQVLANDSELRARLARGGRALAEEFSWSMIAARHENVYHTLL